jgi:hypothetical protein
MTKRDHIVERRAQVRKRFLQTRWSIRNAQLGGVSAVDRPELRALDRYIARAPYFVGWREWHAFRC